MSDAGAADHGGDHTGLLKEAYTMALYVAITLLAALILLAHEAEGRRAGAIALIWGTAGGLALVHWLAYRLAAALVQGAASKHDLIAGVVQIAAALAVAAAATVPTLLAPRRHQATVAVYAIVAALGVIGYLFARNAGAKRLPALLTAAALVATTGAAAALKNWLAGH